MRPEEIAEPSACRYCGIPRRGHALQSNWVAGRHVWTRPHQWQIKDRMLARRAGR